MFKMKQCFLMASLLLTATAAACAQSPSKPTPAANTTPVTPVATTPISNAHVNKMVRIPAGTFTMGSNDGKPNERNPHAVTVATFEMDVTEVTQAAYDDCVETKQCWPALHAEFCNDGNTSRGNHPVNCVSMQDAEKYCKGVGKRLPTEEEWEYAARGTDNRKYPWGNTEPAQQSCWNTIRGTKTCPVGSFPDGASPFGLLDMAGNVWEWTSSPYSTNYQTEKRSNMFVIRGGSWGDDDAKDLTASARSDIIPTFRANHLGFRCAR